MKTTFIVALFLFSNFIFSQQYNLVQKDEKAKEEILIGLCNIKGFTSPPFSDWFNLEYKNYTPDLEVIKQLKQFANKYKLTIVLGTWCSDSKREVPRLFKIMDLAGFLSNSIKILCVDTEKKAGEVNISSLKFDKTPTFFITLSNKEIGIISEKPEKSLETDLLNIFNNHK